MYEECFIITFDNAKNPISVNCEQPATSNVFN